MPSRDSTRILLVDDQDAVRRGLRMRLELEPGLTVVGEASCGPEAVRAAAETRPDVVVMDLVMPAGGGIEATVALVAAHPLARVVVLSLYDGEANRAAALDAGAVAFVAKHEPQSALLAAIRAAAV